MWSDAPLLIFKASPAPDHACKCLWVLQLFECNGAKLHVASKWFSFKYKLGQPVPKQYCSQSIPQCTETISFWVSNAALWKSVQLLGQHHLIVLPVLQFPGFPLFLALDSLSKLLVFLYATTGLLFLFWVWFFTVYLQMSLPGKLAVTVSQVPSQVSTHMVSLAPFCQVIYMWCPKDVI